MGRKLRKPGLLVVLLLSHSAFSWAGVKIKQIAELEGLGPTKLVGYGLVVGLDGTGDSRRSIATLQSVANMLKRFGLTVPQNELRVDNVAAVMVTADLPPFAHPGTRIDVQVSSLGDAESLEGGTLLLTPLVDGSGEVYALAQGAVSIGGFNISTIGGERVRKNYALVGRVPNGAVVKKQAPASIPGDGNLRLVLRNPDFTSARRVADAINQRFGQEIAVAIDAGAVQLAVPEEVRAPGKLVAFLSDLESVETEPDQVARVVVNERTGTVVVGGDVRISTVAVAHGNLTVRIATTPIISQPTPFSQGQTVVVPETQTTVETEEASLTVLRESATVDDLVKALNALGVTPRDLIAIFQALKEAGALRAELVIL
ncbi:MAG: flagellar basal body P-ring protein FlgI [candidate division KSB1 bacterium]|nr:flagellar basal body P-ring protein FlgI [candidate division KSB1 bacterium]